MHVRAATKRYVAERQRRGEFAEETAAMARYVLGKMVDAVGWDTPVRSIDHKKLRSWWNELAGTPSTVRNRLSTVRVFFQWCVDEGMLQRDPCVGFKAPREPQRVPKVLTPAQVGRLLRVARDARDVAVVMLMVHSGLRCGEVVRIQVEDLDAVDHLLVVRGKGARERVVPIPSEAWDAVEAYLLELPAASGPLIRSKLHDNRGLEARTLSGEVRKLCRLAGIKTRPLDGMSAHGLRRTCASDVLDRGANIRQVQELLGHSRLSSTERYLRRTTARELRPVVEGRTYAA
jgi:site-specific recombinase XerD